MLHPYLDSEVPIAIAHRGGAKETVENSLEAFEHAVSLGYRYLETDVHLTRDGVVVVFHDSQLDRVSTETGAIGNWSWADLQNVDLKNGGTIISLDTMLSEFPDSYINIDAKSDAVTSPLLDVLDRADAYERVCIGSFSDKRLRDVRERKGDQACTSLGPRATLRFMASMYRVPVKLPKTNALQLPMGVGGVPILTQRLVERAHELGLKVHAWTIDEASEMNHLLDIGIDGIMTDRPTLLRTVFEQRDLWV